MSKQSSGQPPKQLNQKSSSSKGFFETKRQLDKQPKANPFEDRLLVGCLGMIVVLGLIFLLMGFLVK
ncbi:hypothetical protein [Candidatus Chlorohelix sp.]|uniref:hypothetical protein n=1 Tax=Candidatus Chlorohelix sp. TaxID=3139201 RepID=UPI0030604900